MIKAPAAAETETPASEGDLLTVRNGALYPVEIMAYCYREVASDTAYQAAGAGWVARNGALLGQIQAMAAQAGVPNDARVAFDEPPHRVAALIHEDD